MKRKVFTLHLDPERGAFDDAELAAFVEAHEVLAVHEHLLHVDGRPAWALLVSYRDRVKAGGVRPPQPEREAALEIPEVDRALFEALRRWRNERARRDGRPTYVVFRNQHLADIARLRPRTLTALREVKGVGEGKAREYGEEVLAVVARVLDADPAPAAPGEVPDAAG